jgi:hypothetical protein
MERRDNGPMDVVRGGCGGVRHTRPLFGVSLVVAVLLVLLWQGSLLVLGLAAFGIGVLLLAGVVLLLRLAARGTSHRLDENR